MARPKSDIEPRILRSAHQSFLEAGVDGASLRRIARDAGTNIGMVYYYFPTKDDLFMAVVEEVYKTLLHDLEQALAPKLPVRERLFAMYRRIGALEQYEVEVLQIVVRELLTSNVRRERLLERFQRGHLPLVLRAIADGVSEGEIDDQHHVIVMMLCTFALGVAPQLALRFGRHKFPVPDAPSGDALAKELVSVLLGGIGKSHEEKSSDVQA